MQQVDPQEALVALKVRLDSLDIPNKMSTAAEVNPHTYAHDTINGPEACLDVNGWMANWDRWGYVVDKFGVDKFLDQGDIEATVVFIRENCL